MPKSLPPLTPPQDPLPCSTPIVWPQLPIDRRQQCHERIAQRRIHVSHRAPSEACHHEHQDSPDPART
jgi:hypothetical protein